jgi:hypothetical protein
MLNVSTVAVNTRMISQKQNGAEIAHTLNIYIHVYIYLILTY